MAKSKWVQNLQARLDANPLFWVGNTSEIMCRACGGSGKRVPLYRVTNYNEFNTCCKCKKVYR